MCKGRRVTRLTIRFTGFSTVSDNKYLSFRFLQACSLKILDFTFKIFLKYQFNSLKNISIQTTSLHTSHTTVNFVLSIRFNALIYNMKNRIVFNLSVCLNSWYLHTTKKTVIECNNL